MNFIEETSVGVVLVDFYGTNCRPCKMMEPILDQITGVKIVKVDVDENMELAVEYAISAIPALLFMKDGKVVERLVGLTTQKAIQDKIDEVKIASI